MPRPEPLLISDTPDTRALWPSLSDLADSLAATLPLIPPTSPVLLSGDWGAGKTTLLQAIEERIAQSDIPTIWFDAWKYEGEAGLLPALIRAIWERAPTDMRKKAKARSLYSAAWKSSLAIGTRAIGLAPLFLGLPAVPATAISTSDLKNDLESLKAESERAAKVDNSQILLDSVKSLLLAAWPKTSKFVLIDDLDRCSPDSALNLLNAIRLLMPACQEAECKIIVALDRSILADVVSKKFQGIRNFDGNRFLEKVFPFTFRVPPPTVADIGSLIRHLILSREGAASPTTEVLDSATEQERDKRDALAQALGNPSFANPRLIKRCMNRFFLLNHLEEASTASAAYGPFSDFVLVSWIAACERWPSMRAVLTSQNDRWWSLLPEALEADRPADTVDSEAQRTLDQPGLRPWLQRELLGDLDVRLPLFRTAEARLARWGL